ncbi:MAG: lipase family protein, partial [Desulfobacteraceae bacterium]|nr:lipase family protein [Desulfobacteraceae bacterium]
LDKDEFQAKPLFISGHSLGGALATIAAKELYHKGGIAACYTFGSPRVGDAEWISSIKTPFYRLVNAADCVTMLPPGDEIITLISWIFGFLGRVGEWIKSWLLSNFQGYLHGGNMRYLTNCPAGQYDNVKLLYTVSFLYRMKGLIIKKLPWRAFLADHSISIYKKKLAIIARSRNL